ncbi:formin-like protein 16 [Sus scrofa]|uniref:formin-like protein 16 n=1 Tax=Sus scrofa TaxID=9823 RepID=UPI000A2B1F77|nr:formin-like protein 16 [Sus scrofa]
MGGGNASEGAGGRAAPARAPPRRTAGLTTRAPARLPCSRARPAPQPAPLPAPGPRLAPSRSRALSRPAASDFPGPPGPAQTLPPAAAPGCHRVPRSRLALALSRSLADLADPSARLVPPPRRPRDRSPVEIREVETGPRQELGAGVGGEGACGARCWSLEASQRIFGLHRDRPLLSGPAPFGSKEGSGGGLRRLEVLRDEHRGESLCRRLRLAVSGRLGRNGEKRNERERDPRPRRRWPPPAGSGLCTWEAPKQPFPALYWKLEERESLVSQSLSGAQNELNTKKGPRDDVREALISVPGSALATPASPGLEEGRPDLSSFAAGGHPRLAPPRLQRGVGITGRGARAPPAPVVGYRRRRKRLGSPMHGAASPPARGQPAESEPQRSGPSARRRCGPWDAPLMPPTRPPTRPGAQRAPPPRFQASGRPRSPRSGLLPAPSGQGPGGHLAPCGRPPAPRVRLHPEARPGGPSAPPPQASR